MKIWVDADACPAAIKEILFKAAERTGLPLTLVANRAIVIPRLSNISFVKVAAGADAADAEILRRLGSGDLVITSDIPLAAEAITSGAQVLSPRGEVFDAETIEQRLSVRSFMDTLRSCGIETGGPAAFDRGDIKKCADQLDRLIARHTSRKQR